jgi:hypothetical protein
MARIKSRVPTKEYDEGYDRIFGKKAQDVKKHMEQCQVCKEIFPETLVDSDNLNNPQENK